MKFIITKKIIFHLTLIVLLAATMASHSRGLWPGDDWYGRAGYFIVRFSMEAVEFLGCYFLLHTAFRRLHPLLCLIFAFLLSLPIFVLSITMIDIILGQPELSGVSLYGDKYSLIIEFLDELYWILPKHLSYCGLLALINFRVDFEELFNFRFNLNKSSNLHSETEYVGSKNGTTLINTLSPKYQEQPLRLQAQEHYIKVSTCLGTELVLYKFGRALEELENVAGLQVHRSYWVATDNIVGWTRNKNNIQLELKFGDPVPVSRRFEQSVRQQFSAVDG